MAKMGGLGVAIKQKRSFTVEAEKYLKGLSMQQANEVNLGDPLNQNKNLGIPGNGRAPNGVQADVVKVDHSSATTVSSLGTWPMSVNCALGVTASDAQTYVIIWPDWMSSKGAHVGQCKAGQEWAGSGISGCSCSQSTNVKLEGVVPGGQGTTQFNLDIDN